MVKSSVSTIRKSIGFLKEFPFQTTVPLAGNGSSRQRFKKTTAMRALLDLTTEDFHAWLQAQGQPPLRARQVRRWLFAGRAESFEQMTDLPLALRQALAAQFQVFGSRIARHLRSGDGTNKLLLRLTDEQLIECVLLQEDVRHS